MNRIGAFVVGLGALVAGSGVAKAEVLTEGPGEPPSPAVADSGVAARSKVAYAAPSSGNLDFSGGDSNEASLSAPRAWRPREASNGAAFDDFRLGAFGGVGFPRPLSIEGFARIGNVVGVGLEYSVLPSTTLGGVDTSFWALAGDLRVFPFRNGFFLGVAGGRQHLGASTTLSEASYGSILESVTADTWFINPRIGFLSTSSWGLTLGIDAGVQIPLSASIASTIPSNLPVSVPVATDAENVARILGKSVLPTVDLFRIGLLL